MLKVLSEGGCIIYPNQIVAIVTTITRPRGNAESIVTTETIRGTAEYVKEETKKKLQVVAADKKVVITTIKEQQADTMVCDASA